MIELCVQPIICTMALFTSRWETGGNVVRVDGALILRSVAGIALRRKAAKLSRGDSVVTCLATSRGVGSDERKAILMVPDRRHGTLPAFDRVTRFAICAELA